MKIIIGLGNPGQTYENTRHNIGFEFADIIKEKFEFPNFSFDKNFNANVSKGKIGGSSVVLAKPQTFMNLSGQSARSMLAYYKVAPENLIVVQDDMDIEIGKFKIASDSRSAGHNGIQNIIDNLGTQKFTRIRIGIGKTSEEKAVCKIDAHDYVLGKFSEEEQKKLESIKDTILLEIERSAAL